MKMWRKRVESSNVVLPTPLLFDWFGIGCMPTDNFHSYLQNRLNQTGQTEGQLYSDTSPLSVPWLRLSGALGVTIDI